MQAPVGAVVPQRRLALAQLLVQASRVVVGVCQVGYQLQAALVACQRLAMALLVLECNRAVSRSAATVIGIDNPFEKTVSQILAGLRVRLGR